MTENTLWVDMASPSHPFFFQALTDELDNSTIQATVRDKTETVDLAEEVGFDYEILGRDFDNTLLRKFGIPLRTGQLAFSAPRADVSLSSRNAMCILASKARGIPSIHFTDNDITAHVDALPFEKLYNRLEAMATYNVVPSAFETDELINRGADPEQVITHEGYKEDIYIANFEPDPRFTDALPFDDYIVLRPEALDAAYVEEVQSIVPQILEQATEAGLNVVYLPRGRGDESYADPYPSDQVYTPSQALNGLQLAWHSQAVLTGSGTMAREAACMSKPAISFFPNELLSVDTEMVEKEMIFHSRTPEEVIDFVTSQSQAERKPSTSRSESVLHDVVTKVDSIIETETSGGTS
ncbi:DUF354 domain-containing protein [Halorubrum ezzemoulense]|uniref:DUF354 domain-containing protein n=1 Tax=Halorubrum ezzemoulense TaxID=337243 RepID=UPI0023305BD4|nr:DUF354 domain-containing protein [Halorubrum ezzemoulense]MDB2252499.1 DUF354 domain-containing protein [Halorubrum ezzemoulense]